MNKRIKNKLLSLILGFVLVIGIVNIALSAQPYLIISASCATTSATYGHIVSINKLMSEKVPEIGNIRIMETAGGVENTMLYGRGDVEIAPSTSFESKDLYNGEGKFKGKANPNSRLLFNEAPKIQQYFIVKESGVNTLQELTGKPFSAGAVGSGSERHTKETFAVLGIEPKWFPASWKHLTDAVLDGRIIGFAKSGGPGDAMINQIAATKPIVFLGLNSEQKNKMLALKYLPITLKAGSYPGQSIDIDCIGYTMPWLVKKDLPVDVVYQMAKAVNENYKEVARGSSIAKETIDMFGSVAAATVKMPIIPLHLGTYKYLKELGMKIPEEIVPPEAK